MVGAISAITTFPDPNGWKRYLLIMRPLTMRKIAPFKALLGLFVEWFRQAEQPR